jgi:hypothetical protein
MKRFGLIVVALALACFAASASTIYTNALPVAALNDGAGNARSNVAFGEADPFPFDGIAASLDGDTLVLNTNATVNTLTTWMVASQALPWATTDPLGNQALGLEMSSVSLWFRVDPGNGPAVGWTQLDTGSFDTSFDVATNPNAVGSSNANISATNVTYSNGESYEDPNNPGSFFPLWQLSFSDLGLNLAAGVTYDFAVTGLGYGYPGGPAVPTLCANDPSQGADCVMDPNNPGGYGYWYNSFSNPMLSGSTQDGPHNTYLRCNYDSTGVPNSDPCGIADPVAEQTFNKGADMNVELDGTAASSIPEPSTIALFAAGFAGIGFLRRRKR